jgi:hypothetical protein
MKKLLTFVLLCAWRIAAQVPTVPNSDHATFRTNLNTSLGRAADIQGNYANPSWITSLAYTKITGVPSFEPAITAGTSAQYWRGDKTWQTLNAAAVTNAADTTGSYSNPSWITALAWAKLTGVPSFYGTVQANGTPATQRATLNLKQGTNVTISCADNITITDCTISATAGAGGYATVQANGSSLTQRSILNFGSEFTAVDNSGSSRTDVSINSVAWAKLTGVPSTFAPSAHAASHKNGGSDEVATATPAANAIPKAGAGGTLASGWIPTLNQNTTGTAAALAANGANCSAGSVAAGVDASGAAEGCVALTSTNLSDTANLARVNSANTFTSGSKQFFQASTSTAGARIGAAALPSSPTTGDLAVDSGDSNKLKFYDGSAWVATSGGGGGGISSVSGGTGLSCNTVGGAVTCTVDSADVPLYIQDVAANRPGTCAVGLLFFATDTHVLSACDATDTWHDYGGGGGGTSAKTLYYSPAAKNMGGVGAAAFQCNANCPTPSVSGLTSGSAVMASLNVTAGTTNQTSQDQFIVPAGYSNQQVTMEIAYFSSDSTHSTTVTPTIANINTSGLANPTFAASCSPITATASSSSNRTVSTCTFTPSWAPGDLVFWKLAYSTSSMTQDFRLLSVRFYATF